MSQTSDRTQRELFEYKGKASLGQVVPLGLQHVAAAIVGVITPAILISDRCGLSAQDKTVLVQVSLLISGLATLLQLFPIFRVGSGLPVIIGVSFAYVPALMAIGGTFDIATVFGAQLCGAAAAILVGLFIKWIRPLFPPLVTGTVIVTIGLSLYPTAVRYMAGGGSIETNPQFGSWQNWLVAVVTLLIVIICNNFGRGIVKLASILLGMAGGYLLALAMGMVDMSASADAAWFQMVEPLRFGLRFEPSAIVSLVVMFIVNAVQDMGQYSATTMDSMDRHPTNRELSGGIVANGLVSAVGALFGGLPVAAFGQNVGIVTVTKVINRRVFALASLVMVVAGLIPKLAAALTTIPQCVIGGATVSVFASITMTGFRMVASAGLTPRNTSVVGLALALGMGVTGVAECLAGFPTWVTTVFGSSSVVISTLVAIGLNLVLPKDQAVKQN